MDASQPELPKDAASDDVEISQAVAEDAEVPPAIEEQPSEPNNSNPQPKRTRGVPKAVPSAERPPGKSLLPLARVQKILKADKELPTCAKEAVFLISVATEEFIKRLGQAGQQQATREKRTTVQRRDVEIAVRRSDEFAFLEELLSSGTGSLPAAAPAKRKQKVPVSNPTDIMEAFGKGKEKATIDPDATTGGSERTSAETHDKPTSRLERPDSTSPTHNDQRDTRIYQGEGEEDGNMMDMS